VSHHDVFPHRTRMSIDATWADLYARSILILHAFKGQFASLTPLWLIGLGLGATLTWFLRPHLQKRLSRPGKLGGATLLSLVVGILLGLISPFSLLSLMGVLRDLLRRRQWVALAVGLSLANPLLDPTMFTFTALALGPRLAWARVVTVCLAALVAGSVLLLWERRIPMHQPGQNEACGSAPVPPRTWGTYFRYLGSQIYTCGRYYLLALLLTAWIEVLVPLRVVAPLWGSDSRLSLLLAAILGVPLYLCGGGAIAIVRELIAQGLSAGAALAFLTFGPATTVRTLTGLGAIGGRRMVWVFLGSTLAMSLLAGYLLDMLA
jgi:uncharacterized protein